MMVAIGRQLTKDEDLRRKQRSQELSGTGYDVYDSSRIFVAHFPASIAFSSDLDR